MKFMHVRISRRQRGGGSNNYGISGSKQNARVKLYQSGDANFLYLTDAMNGNKYGY